jgi:branched-chain amino acid transport system permease protein
MSARALVLNVLAFAVAVLVAWLGAAILPRSVNEYQMTVINGAAIWVVAAVSLNLINGYTGQFSIGHAGFMLVGAYAAATMTKYVHTGLAPALVVGGLFAAVCGLLVGIPTLRLRGDYLAIVTLGFGEIIKVVFLNLERVPFTSWDLGAARGLSGVEKLAGFFPSYLCAFITMIVILNLVNSSPGRALKSIREDELAAEVMGVDTTRYKVAAFVIGAFFAGIAGGLYIHQYQIVNPKEFGFIKSFEIVVMVVLGGMGSTTGVAVAAIFLTFLPEWLRSLAQWRLVIYSLMLILLMLWRPQGLMGSREIGGWLLSRRRKAGRAGPSEAGGVIS